MLENAQTPLLHIADVSGSALFNADCMDILPLIPDESVDVILTDPPYNIGYADWDKFFHIPEITKEWYRILKPNGSVFCFAGVFEGVAVTLDCTPLLVFCSLVLSITFSLNYFLYYRKIRALLSNALI